MAYRSMVKRAKRIKIVLGLNIATVLLPMFLGLFELIVVLIHTWGGIKTDEWGHWIRCLYWLAGFVTVWLVCVFMALLVCKKRLVIEGHLLRITKGKQILYQCDVSEIRTLERIRFSPLLDSEPGSITIVNYVHPVPKDLPLLMSWISYKRLVNFIKKVNCTANRFHQ